MHARPTATCRRRLHVAAARPPTSQPSDDWPAGALLPLLNPGRPGISKESTPASEVMERRLRPIAPKPMPPPVPMGAAAASSALWRAHKRGREDQLLFPPPGTKREREATSSSSSYPYPYNLLLSPPILPAAGAGAGAGAGVAPMVATSRGRRYKPPMPESLVTGCEDRLRRLSLVPGSPAAAAASPWPPATAPPSSDATTRRRVVPVERDLISKLQVPKVIKPRPARPLWTTICIDSSNIAVGGGVAYPETVSAPSKTAREVEAELELPGALPAIVSGHGNRVHLVNDAYKAMVGQPVCPWLDSLPGAGASRRINGIVVLDVRTFGPAPRLPNAGSSSDAFPCTARITWEHGGGSAIASLTVPCTVEHLTGSSGDYRSIWRFDSSRASIIYCIV